MKWSFLLFYILIFTIENVINNKNELLNGVYSIFCISNHLYFTVKTNKLILSDIQSNFRFVPVKSNIYYIEHKSTNKRLGINNNDKIILYNKNRKINRTKISWIIYKTFINEYLIQNNYKKKYIFANNSSLQFIKNKDLLLISLETNVIKNQSFIFNFIKLCEERNEEEKKYIKILKKEPIDLIIKYIDLTDKTLNRTGIKQIYKDEDNEELRYSIRSIFLNIPWIRKIYILMPNDKVKFFKDKENINDKIIYIKDKDFLGFDSANIYAFTFNLFKLENFGISKNFIYMEDDFFLGKSLNKYDFFYYDEKKNKVVPYLITYYFYEMNKSEIISNYNELFKVKETIHPHSLDGWWMSIYATDIYFSQCYKDKIIKTRFTHNAKGENIEELREIFELIKNYEYINETLFSKERNILTLNQPHFVNLYQLNIYHKKVHSISYRYIEIEKIKNQKLLSPLFVINTSGNHKPLKRQYKIQNKKMEQRFPDHTLYEINNKIKKNIYRLKLYFIILKKFIIYNFIKIYCILIFFLLEFE